MSTNRRLRVRIIIAGSRTFVNTDSFQILTERCDQVISSLPENADITIVSGCAKGADTLGEAYATMRGYKIKRFPANWNTLGKAAGYIRNKEMLNYANPRLSHTDKGLLIAFWDEKSNGTANMIQIAKSKDIDVYVFNTQTGESI